MSLAVHYSQFKVIEGNNFLVDYDLFSKIGQGNSIVYELRHKQKRNEICAGKEIIIKNDQDEKQIKHEIELFKLVSEDNHSKFIKFYDYCIVEWKQCAYQTNRICIIRMELAKTSLDQIIQQKQLLGNYLTEEQILQFAQNIIDAFAYLQKDKQIAHQDIKPENILIINPENIMQFKICDIGSARRLDPSNSDTQTNTIEGTIPFLAPELVNAIQQSKVKIKYNSFKSDVFSLGLCILYLITNKRFKQAQRRQMSDELYKEVLDEWMQHAELMVNKNTIIINVLRQMLIFDWNKRPDFAEIQKYLKQLQMDDQIEKAKLQEAEKLKVQQLQISTQFLLGSDLQVNSRSPSKSPQGHKISSRVNSAVKNNNDKQQIQLSSRNSNNNSASKDQGILNSSQINNIKSSQNKSQIRSKYYNDKSLGKIKNNNNNNSGRNLDVRKVDDKLLTNDESPDSALLSQNNTQIKNQNTISPTDTERGTQQLDNSQLNLITKQQSDNQIKNQNTQQLSLKSSQSSIVIQKGIDQQKDNLFKSTLKKNIPQLNLKSSSNNQQISYFEQSYPDDQVSTSKTQKNSVTFKQQSFQSNSGSNILENSNNKNNYQKQGSNISDNKTTGSAHRKTRSSFFFDNQLIINQSDQPEQLNQQNQQQIIRKNTGSSAYAETLQLNTQNGQNTNQNTDEKNFRIKKQCKTIFNTKTQFNSSRKQQLPQQNNVQSQNEVLKTTKALIPSQSEALLLRCNNGNQKSHITYKEINIIQNQKMSLEKLNTQETPSNYCNTQQILKSQIMTDVKQKLNYNQQQHSQSQKNVNQMKNSFFNNNSNLNKNNNIFSQSEGCLVDSNVNIRQPNDNLKKSFQALNQPQDIQNSIHLRNNLSQISLKSTFYNDKKTIIQESQLLFDQEQSQKMLSLNNKIPQLNQKQRQQDYKKNRGNRINNVSAIQNDDNEKIANSQIMNKTFANLIFKQKQSIQQSNKELFVITRAEHLDKYGNEQFSPLKKSSTEQFCIAVIKIDDKSSQVKGILDNMKQINGISSIRLLAQNNSNSKASNQAQIQNQQNVSEKLEYISEFYINLHLDGLIKNLKCLKINLRNTSLCKLESALLNQNKLEVNNTLISLSLKFDNVQFNNKERQKLIHLFISKHVDTLEDITLEYLNVFSCDGMDSEQQQVIINEEINLVTIDIKQCKRLQQLFLDYSSCRLHQNSVQKIFENIENLSQLNTLLIKLNSNEIRFTNELRWKLNKRLRNLTLNLSDNKLEDISKLSMQFGELTELICLNLIVDNAQFNGLAFIHQIFTQIGKNCKRLQEFYISLKANNLDDKFISYIIKFKDFDYDNFFASLNTLSFNFIDNYNMTCQTLQSLFEYTLKRVNKFKMLNIKMGRIIQTTNVPQMGNNSQEFNQLQKEYNVQYYRVENLFNEMQMNQYYDINILTYDLDYQIINLVLKQPNENETIIFVNNYFFQFIQFSFLLKEDSPQLKPHKLKELCEYLEIGNELRPNKLYKCLDCIQKNIIYKDITFCQRCIKTCHKNHKYLNIQDVKGICYCSFLEGQCQLQTQNIECTRMQTENIPIYQDAYLCVTCSQNNCNLFICKLCKDCCHLGHEIKQYSIRKFECKCSRNH